MPRIIYYAFPTGRIQGGIKITLRHVEALRDLGFDAVFATTPQCQVPSWFEHRAPVIVDAPISPKDILVLPEEAENAIRQAGRRPPSKNIIFCQNQFILSALGVSAIDDLMKSQAVTFMTVGRVQTNLVQKLYPEATVATVPCFADERIFRPSLEKSDAVAFVPKKRPLEPQVIRGYLAKLHSIGGELAWLRIADMSERDVARSLGGARVYLSLSRFESVGMATLEAMASGCICAGFTGITGPHQEYATSENGFWAPEDDCEAAAAALARAIELARSGGEELQAYQAAAQATAAAWSYQRFREVLEETWMRLAPEARIKNGPLD